MRFIVTTTFVVDDQKNSLLNIRKQFSLGCMTVYSQEDFESRSYEPIATVITAVDSDLDHKTVVEGYTF